MATFIGFTELLSLWNFIVQKREMNQSKFRNEKLMIQKLRVHLSPVDTIPMLGQVTDEKVYKFVAIYNCRLD